MNVYCTYNVLVDSFDSIGSSKPLGKLCVVNINNCFIFRWELVQAISSEERVTELSVRPVQKREIAKVPCIRLRISADGRYLAVGSSDGSVSVYLAENLRKVQSFAHHDLPVTGLSFAPQRVVLSEAASSGNVVALLASCSADNKMVIMQVKSKQTTHFNLPIITC